MAFTFLVALAPAALASDTSFTLNPAVLVSGPSALAGCAVGADPNANPPSINYPNTAVEPSVAINPTNPDNILGAYQQDRWSDGASKGLVAASSIDGGLTWSQSLAEFSICSDNPATSYLSPFDRATDPWVSFDSSGRAYQSSLGIDFPTGLLSGVEVATSIDGGATWSLPARLITDDNPVQFNDKESVTGDWRPGVGAGKAYATWIRGDLPGFPDQSLAALQHSFAYSGLPMFSQTGDGGQTWSTPVAMTSSLVYMQGNQIVVLPDGTLVDVGAVLFRGSGVQPAPQQFFWAALVSKNGGKTWGAPIKIAPLGTQLLTNPDIPNPTSADGLATGFNHVKLTKSTDGGKNWSRPVDVTSTPASTHSFNGTVSVTADGTVAVLYYDFRNNTAAPGLPTDVWLTHSHDGGLTWSEQHVYGPFDMENAPVARGWFLGDYQGLAAIGNDLMLFFSVATAAPDSASVIAVRANRTGP
jgi:hypothetical protein